MIEKIHNLLVFKFSKSIFWNIYKLKKNLKNVLSELERDFRQTPDEEDDASSVTTDGAEEEDEV